MRIYNKSIDDRSLIDFNCQLILSMHLTDIICTKKSDSIDSFSLNEHSFIHYIFIAHSFAWLYLFNLYSTTLTLTLTDWQQQQQRIIIMIIIIITMTMIIVITTSTTRLISLISTFFCLSLSQMTTILVNNFQYENSHWLFSLIKTNFLFNSNLKLPFLCCGLIYSMLTFLFDI